MLLSPMSALKRIPDSGRTSREVRKVPQPDSCAAANTISFDHFVGARTQLLLFLDDLAPSLFGKLLLNH